MIAVTGIVVLHSAALGLLLSGVVLWAGAIVRPARRSALRRRALGALIIWPAGAGVLGVTAVDATGAAAWASAAVAGAVAGAVAFPTRRGVIGLRRRQAAGVIGGIALAVATIVAAGSQASLGLGARLGWCAALLAAPVVGFALFTSSAAARMKLTLSVAVAATFASTAALVLGAPSVVVVAVGSVIVAVVVAGSPWAGRYRTGDPAHSSVAGAVVAVIAVAVVVVPSAVPLELPPAPVTSAADEVGVTVAPPVSPAKIPSFEECNATGGYALGCFVDYFTDRASLAGVDVAVTELEIAFETNPATPFASYCHETAHALGVIAFADLGDRSAALAGAPDACAGGFYHGVWDSYLAEMSDEEFLDALPTMCAGEQNSGLGSWSCEHIAGHDVGRRATSPNDGVQACRTFAADQLVWDRCVAGAYMEHFSDVSYLESVTGESAAKVFEVCRAADDDMKALCYGESWTAVLITAENNFPDAFASCVASAEEAYVPRCLRAVAQGVAFQARFEPAVIIELCSSLGEASWSEACLEQNGGVVTLSTGDRALGEQVCAAIDDVEVAAVCLVGVAGNAEVVASAAPGAPGAHD